MSLSLLVTKGITRFKEDHFFRNAMLFTLANLIASVINYAYYPIMSRVMDIESYGELQIITSFLLQLTTVFVGLNLINVTIFANHDESQRKTLIIALQKALFWLMVMISLGIVLISPLLRDFFHFTSLWPFLFVIPSLLIDAVSIFWTSYLQANRDFFSLSTYSIVTSFGKLLFSVALVVLGFGVAGGIGGVAMGLLAGLLSAKLATKHLLPNLRQTLRLPNRQEMRLIKSHLVYIVEVIVALVSMSILLSLDTMLVKHLFAADFAGLYAGISTVARILFFASAPIVTVMLPSIILRDMRASKQAFIRTVSISAAICTAGLVVFALLPSQVISLFLGGAFVQNASWLPLLSVVAILVTLTNIIINYLLALRSHLAIVISLMSLVVATILIFLHHDTVQQIVLASCSGLLAGQIVFAVSYVWRRGHFGHATSAPSAPSANS